LKFWQGFIFKDWSFFRVADAVTSYMHA